MDDDDSSTMYSRASQADSFSSEESITSLNDFIVTTPVEIIQTVKDIDTMFSQGSIVENFDVIWERLHVLKGDILTLAVGSKVISAVGMINSFREFNSDEDLQKHWCLFRDTISQWLHSNEDET